MHIILLTLSFSHILFLIAHAETFIQLKCIVDYSRNGCRVRWGDNYEHSSRNAKYIIYYAFLIVGNMSTDC